MHSIDRVLTPPLSMEDTALAAGLTSAIGAANKLNLDWWRDDDATYFMPNNEAFRKVGSALKDIPDDELRNILTYHYLNDTGITSLYIENEQCQLDDSGRRGRLTFSQR